MQKRLSKHVACRVPLDFASFFMLEKRIQNSNSKALLQELPISVETPFVSRRRQRSSRLFRLLFFGRPDSGV
jgi:hypothetical protein